METIWDWITVGAFGALIVLMLQRSSEDVPRDRLVEYLPPALGCALANYVGNNHSDLGAAAIMVLVVAYTVKVLKFPSLNASGRGNGDDRR